MNGIKKKETKKGPEIKKGVGGQNLCEKVKKVYWFKKSLNTLLFSNIYKGCTFGP